MKLFVFLFVLCVVPSQGGKLQRSKRENEDKEEEESSSSWWGDLLSNVVESIPEKSINQIKDSLYDKVSSSIDSSSIDKFNSFASQVTGTNDTASLIKQTVLSGVSSYAQNGTQGAFEGIKKGLSEIPTKHIVSGLQMLAANLPVETIKSGVSGLADHVPEGFTDGVSSLAGQVPEALSDEVYKVITENITPTVAKEIREKLPGYEELKSIAKKIPTGLSLVESIDAIAEKIPKKTVDDVAGILKHNFAIDRMDKDPSRSGIIGKIQDMIDSVKDFFERMAYRFISKYIWYMLEETMEKMMA